LKRVNNILQNENYKNYIRLNEDYEIDRIFCRHGMQHLLDVARIGYIMSLEKDLRIKKSLIYAASLLHDIGRWKEYKDGTPHDAASAELAKKILIESGYNSEDTDEILVAIRNHREKDNIPGSLSDILSKSDKLSRSCFNCPAENQCNWPQEKKNLNIQF